MIAKTALRLIVITTTCQTALQFARGEIAKIVVKTPTTVASCNQLGRLSALINHLSMQVNNSSFENLDEVQRRDRKKKCEYSNSEIVFEYSNGIQVFEYSLTSLIFCLTSTVNCCGHVVMVCYPNHTFPRQA